ncbi:MAG: hypothetical protein KUG73_15185 [Pseudomonadales bacterium]|nr:hypothetical protein [Pseudomonadales bacterium]
MKKFLAVTAISTAALVSGCASHNAYQSTAPLNAEVKTNLNADISVGKKISGASTSTMLLGLFQVQGDTKFSDGVVYGGSSSALNLLDPIAATKSAAAYNAVSAAGVDVLVAPTYTVDVQNYFVVKVVTVNVEGFSGTIKSVK